MAFNKNLSKTKHKFYRFMYGDKPTENMTLDEMHVLERNLEVWMYKVRSVKVIKLIPSNIFFSI